MTVRIDVQSVRVSKSPSGAEGGVGVFFKPHDMGFSRKHEEIVLGIENPATKRPTGNARGQNEGKGGQAIGKFLFPVSAPAPKAKAKRDRERGTRIVGRRVMVTRSASSTAGLDWRDHAGGRAGGRLRHHAIEVFENFVREDHEGDIVWPVSLPQLRFTFVR